MAGAQHAAELTSPRCVNPSGQIRPSPPPTLAPNPSPAARVWGAASSPPPAVLYVAYRGSSRGCACWTPLLHHKAAALHHHAAAAKGHQFGALPVQRKGVEGDEEGGEGPEEGQGRWGDLHVHGVGRRREDEDLDCDDNQEDEPTHKSTGAGHEDDDSSSCTTSRCCGYTSFFMRTRKKILKHGNLQVNPSTLDAWMY